MHSSHESSTSPTATRTSLSTRPLPFQPEDGYLHTELNPLTLTVTNLLMDPTDFGREVYADAVRFVHWADLSIESTPLQFGTDIRLPGGIVDFRDVVIVAMENGRIYCMDAVR